MRVIALLVILFGFALSQSVTLRPAQQICTGQYSVNTPCCCTPGNSYYLYVYMLSFDLTSIPAGATITSAILTETTIYTQGPATLITSAIDADHISGSYYSQPPRISPPLDTRSVTPTGYLQSNAINIDVTAEVNRVRGIGRPLNIVQYNNAGSSFNYDFVEILADTGNIGYSSPSQQPHLTVTYTTAPPPGAPCESDGDCMPFTGYQPYATCNNGNCQCRPSFSGYATAESPCTCSTNNVQYDSVAHCLSPGQCLPGRQDLCSSVSQDYNFVNCGSDNQCHCNPGFGGAASLANPCNCPAPATVSWVNGIAYCNQPGQCTADYLCAAFSLDPNFVHCGGDGHCQCNDGFSGAASISSLCACAGTLSWDNTVTPAKAICTI